MIGHCSKQMSLGMNVVVKPAFETEFYRSRNPNALGSNSVGSSVGKEVGASVGLSTRPDMLPSGDSVGKVVGAEQFGSHLDGQFP